MPGVASLDTSPKSVPIASSTPRQAPALQFTDVCRDYVTSWLPRRSLRAVDRVSFAIQPGEVFGLLGPNRAGKTTLVKLLLSLCRPTSGEIVRLGQPATDRRTLGRVGYMHENHAFPRYLNARELLSCYGAMSLIPSDQLDARVRELLALVGLTDRADDPIWRYSKGMVQRLGLAQALLADPELLVLDEPTEGLDLAGRKLLRAIVGQMKQRGRTVLLVSHVLPEVENLCDRVAVLCQGRLLCVRAMSDLVGPGHSLEQALSEVIEQ